MHGANVAAAAGVATAEVVSTNSVEGERCNMELALDAPSTPQPAAGAEGVKMFTTPMQQLQENRDSLLNQDSLKSLGDLLMDQMQQDEQRMSDQMQQGEQQISSFMTGYADQQEEKQVELLQALQDRCDKHLETGLRKVREGLTVRLDMAQQETDKQIEDLAGQASALSQRLDNDQAE